MDARTGFVHPAITLGIAPLVAAAREHGVAMLSVVNCRGIIGSLWFHLETIAAEHGLLAIGCCNSPAFVAQEGGSLNLALCLTPMPKPGPKPTPNRRVAAGGSSAPTRSGTRGRVRITSPPSWPTSHAPRWSGIGFRVRV